MQGSPGFSERSPRSFGCAIAYPVISPCPLRSLRLYVANEIRRESLAIGEYGRQVLGEVTYVAGEHELALRVQPGRHVHPARDNGLPGLRQPRVRCIVDAAGAGELLCDA